MIERLMDKMREQLRNVEQRVISKWNFLSPGCEDWKKYCSWLLVQDLIVPVDDV